MRKTPQEVEDRITQLRVVERMSLRDIAAIVGCDHTTVDRIVRKHPLTPEERTEIWRTKCKGRKRTPDGRLASGPELTNQRFGRLIAIERVFSNFKDAVWKCVCDCGNFTEVRAHSLTRGGTQSCGCYSREMKIERLTKDPRLVKEHSMYLSYIKAAEDRNLEFGLTEEQCKSMFTLPCEYCGLEAVIGKTKTLCRFNGIDRVDSKSGYFIDNCVPCCRDCNYAKRSKTREEFLLWAQRLYHKQFQRSGCVGGDAN